MYTKIKQIKITGKPDHKLTIEYNTIEDTVRYSALLKKEATLEWLLFVEKIYPAEEAIKHNPDILQSIYEEMLPKIETYKNFIDIYKKIVIIENVEKEDTIDAEITVDSSTKKIEPEYYLLKDG